jgi:4-hydroxybenzoate polyprenyltransferase
MDGHLLPIAVPQLGWIYWAALAAIVALLVWEHAIAKADDLSRINQAFFSANALIGLVLLAAIAADLWLRSRPPARSRRLATCGSPPPA